MQQWVVIKELFSETLGARQAMNLSSFSFGAKRAGRRSPDEPLWLCSLAGAVAGRGRAACPPIICMHVHWSTSRLPVLAWVQGRHDAQYHSPYLNMGGHAPSFLSILTLAKYHVSKEDLFSLLWSQQVFSNCWAWDYRKNSIYVFLLFLPNFQRGLPLNNGGRVSDVMAVVNSESGSNWALRTCCVFSQRCCFVYGHQHRTSGGVENRPDPRRSCPWSPWGCESSRQVSLMLPSSMFLFAWFERSPALVFVCLQAPGTSLCPCQQLRWAELRPARGSSLRRAPNQNFSR